MDLIFRGESESSSIGRLVINRSSAHVPHRIYCPSFVAWATRQPSTFRRVWYPDLGVPIN